MTQAWQDMTAEWIPSIKLHSECRRARKEYKCKYCTKPIIKGSVYISECWIVDGEFDYSRHHVQNNFECYGVE